MTKDGDAIDRIRDQIEEIKEHIATVRSQIGDWDRERFHDMSQVSHATAVTVGVIQERQKADGQSLQRTEGMVEEIRDAIRVLTGDVRVLDKDFAVLKATTPQPKPDADGIPSHQRNAVIIAAVGLGAALGAVPMKVWEALAGLAGLIKSK